MPSLSPKIIRSGLEELRKLVLNARGAYGAQRVERAADEVPNLEDQYTLGALKKAFTGPNAKSVMTLDPADFQKYANPLSPNYDPLTKQGYYDEALGAKPTLSSILGTGGFDAIPQLKLWQMAPGDIPEVLGHQGRHRNAALAAAGYDRTLVQGLPLNTSMDFQPQNADLSSLPHSTQEEYISALQARLAQHPGIYAELHQSLPQVLRATPNQFKKGGLVQACGCKHGA